MQHQLLLIEAILRSGISPDFLFYRQYFQVEKHTHPTYNEERRYSMYEDIHLTTIQKKELLLEKTKTMNLLSDTFMSVALNDTNACQHVLRILTGIQDLIVKEVRTQHKISKLASHNAILDVLAEDSLGRLYNIEIQRADTLDHARRTRFYGSMIDSEYLMKGANYSDLPDVYIIYVSETDL